MSALKFTLPLWTALACLPVQGLGNPLLGSAPAGFSARGAATVIDVPTGSGAGDVGLWSCNGATLLTGFDGLLGVAVPDPQVPGALVYAGIAHATSAVAQLSTAIGLFGDLGPWNPARVHAFGRRTRGPGVHPAFAVADIVPEFRVSDNASAASGDTASDPDGAGGNAGNGAAGAGNGTGNGAAGDGTGTGNVADGTGAAGAAGNTRPDSGAGPFQDSPPPVARQTPSPDACRRGSAPARADAGDRNAPAGRCAGTSSGDDGLNAGFDTTLSPDDPFGIDARERAPVLSQVVVVSEAATALLFGLGLAGLAGMRRTSGL